VLSAALNETDRGPENITVSGLDGVVDYARRRMDRDLETIAYVDGLVAAKDDVFAELGVEGGADVRLVLRDISLDDYVARTLDLDSI
jgi:hypothetical protein